MSYITVPAERVIACCKNWLAYNEIRNCQAAARVLVKKAKEKKYIFFGGEIGYQKAYEYYTQNASDCFDSLKYHCCFWEGGTWETVNNLLLLAENGDPVIITDKHAFIFNFDNIEFKKVD